MGIECQEVIDCKVIENITREIRPQNGVRRFEPTGQQLLISNDGRIYWKEADGSVAYCGTSRLVRPKKQNGFIRSFLAAFSPARLAEDERFEAEVASRLQYPRPRFLAPPPPPLGQEQVEVRSVQARKVTEGKITCEAWSKHSLFDHVTPITHEGADAVAELEKSLERLKKESA